MKSGQQPKGNVRIKWSTKFAYAIGLLVADGWLSKDGRHMSLTSKDKLQVETFKQCLNLKTKTSKKFSGHGSMAYHTQFGDVLFYRFLNKIGIFSAKSNTIASLKVPSKYFMDYLRGYFDGDGSSYSYYDRVWKTSYRFYISFTSGSEAYLNWFQKKLQSLLMIKGYFSYNKNNPYVQLKYSKREAVIISKNMYYNRNLPCLKRKRQKIEKSLNIIKCRGGEIGRRATFRS